MKIETIFEDNHLIAVVKPQGVPVQKDSSGDQDLQSLIMQHLKDKYNKPGNVFLGIVHRLDRPVGGVMVFAKTSKAASRLSEQIRQNMWKKQYVTIVEGIPFPDSGFLEDHLLKDSGTNTVTIVKSGVPGAKKAELKYQIIEKNSHISMLKIELLTGRSHQIRVQLSSRGWPIMNDHKYNKNHTVGSNIMLWAEKLEIIHPVSREQMKFNAQPPIIFREIINS
ncbi:MAG TPA: RluA family pseudouridine synthase [bacterium]|nr:RluA family pseudouridine synthase [bacterium]HPS29638.1 RluA family pseudouridine synthase [bacterium]